jgi:hypothetical protein
MNEIEMTETTIATGAPFADSFAEAVAAALIVEQEARDREAAALEVLSTAEGAFQVALAEAGLEPDDAAIRLALDSARRAYDRADAAAGIAEAGVKEAVRRREEAERSARDAADKARKWAAYLESIEHSRAGLALCGELADFLRATQRDLAAHDRRFRELAADEMGLRTRGGAPEHFSPPSEWGPIYNGLQADCERMARLFDRARRSDET